MANYDKYGRTVSTDKGSASAQPDGISSVSASGGPYVPQRWVFQLAAGAGGSADDVTLFSSALPFKCQLLDAYVKSDTTVSMGTVTLRSASGGGGTALSSAITAAAAGIVSRSAGVAGIATALASGSSLYARRSDSAIAGQLVIEYIPTV